MDSNNFDIYGDGQIFGHFLVAYCREHGIDIDSFFSAIKKESSIFISGMADGIGSVRDQRVSFNTETFPC